MGDQLKAIKEVLKSDKIDLKKLNQLESQIKGKQL